MPTYEYECHKCGGAFEAFQRMSARPLTACKLCGAKGTVARLVSSGAGVIFKGSGFYATDYKKSSSAGTSAKAEKKSEDIEKSVEKLSETKEKADKTAPKSSSSSDKS